MKDEIVGAINESMAVKSRLKELSGVIAQIAEEVVQTLRNGGKIILLGNGGSAADAQHIAAELVGKFRRVRAALPAIALTTNTSILTAVANDLSFEEVFARQIEAITTEKDLVIGISTSGRSRNVLKAIEAARKRGTKTIGLTGGDGGDLSKMVDLALIVPSNSTPRIQESHITLGHILCDLVEKEIFGKNCEK